MRQATADTLGKTLTEADEQISAVCADWFETCATIRGRAREADGSERITLTTAPALTMNELQWQIDDTINWCELNNEPCRLIVLKPRKEGSTTFLVAKSYHLMRSTEAQLLQIGDQTDTTQLMWDMLRTYQETDAFREWPSRLRRMTTSAKAGARATWTNGATAWAETAGDKRAGQGTTPTIIHAEEVAHWGADGAAANASDTMLALLNAIADIAGTYVFVSSTPNGVGNWYHRTYSGAVSLAERKTGKKGNGWIKVFMPWHKSEWSMARITDQERAEIEDTLTESEKVGRIRWGWSTERIAWRRQQIAAKCDGSEEKFAQEQPSDQTSCFLTSGSPRFDPVGVAKLLAMCDGSTAKLGTISEHNGIFSFVPDERGWAWIEEEPRAGCNYSLGGDPMTGRQSEGSKERDNHAVPLLREAFTDERKLFHPDEIVAAIHVQDGCQWDIDVLAHRMWLLSGLYGKCVCVPEANNAGMELIAQLRHLGVNIWQREDIDHIRPGKKLKKPGYWTGPGKSGTRSAWVEKMAETIRECAGEPGTVTFVCRYRPACEEFGRFVRHPDGSCSATDGEHDDWVSSIGILLRVRCFTRMAAPQLWPAHMLAYAGAEERTGGWG